MSSYGLSVLPSLSSPRRSSSAPSSPLLSHPHSSSSSPFFPPTERTISPIAGTSDNEDDEARAGSRRESNSSSSSDEDRARLTGPDLSRLTPRSAVHSSPKRAPGPSAPSLTRSSSSPQDPTTSSAVQEDSEDESEAPITPLPRSLPRPKTKVDRERERANGFSSGGQKREGLGTKLARKRADSLKWAKYASVGTFQVELGLSNDELRRS
ncbi:hypothetical protein Rt10032_c17g5806 [Rhodotorula toruloides]|uniref:Uncharacterized protein n=1 Tax=Rhodotorula toruloides TaxID=5286 RepID=A0A511KN36_RHOTO|nr:hypothetical protein Rt10032_c17g5806 [Rhodotorula toruloides]